MAVTQMSVAVMYVMYVAVTPMTVAMTPVSVTPVFVAVTVVAVTPVSVAVTPMFVTLVMTVTPVPVI